MLREIKVEELRHGMYVAKLDRPWSETPFMFQGFPITSDRQLEALRRLCKTVFVDPDRVEGGAPPPRAPAPAGGSVRGDTAYPERASVEVEMPRARAVYDETRTMIEDAIAAVGSGKVLEGARLTEAVSQIAESVVRNADAMMLLSKMVQRGSSHATRALDVSIYMIVFGRFLQLPREQLDTLGMVGLLQDIGKLRLPQAVLDKTSVLSRDELERVKSHVGHSVDIVREARDLPESLAGLVALHHERHDGSGYPKGLRGAEIGLIGSIAAIADTFDALTVPRAYAQQCSPSNALSVLFKGRGTLFHGALVEQFIQCIGIFPVGSVVELNTGEIGIVITQNLVRRLQPRVMVVRDAKGNPVRPHKILDLIRDPMAGPDMPYRIVRTLEYDKAAIDPRELFL